MGIGSVHAAPAEMVGHPRRIGALNAILKPAKLLPVGPVRRPEIHRNAVLHDLILFQDLIEDVQRSRAADHKILRDNFEPVHDGLSSQNVIVVPGAQPESDALVSEVVESIRRHVELHLLGGRG